MAGLAGHNVDEMAGLFNVNSHQWSVGSNSSISPEGMVNDLSSLFEAAGGLQMIGQQSSDGHPRQNSQPQEAGTDGAYNASEVGSGAQINDEGLSNILKELF